MDRQILGGVMRQRQEAAQRPDWTPIRRLPAYVPQAFSSVVDPTFENRRPLEEGAEGTTLSRELVRQVHLLRRNLAGEAREILMGPLLERRMAKSEVLELYLNRVYMGRVDGFPVYGIHHAAREFFGKRPEELTLSQAATLAGLLLPPRISRPERQLGAVGARRNEVLRQMVLAGNVTPAALEAAMQEPLGFVAVAEYTPMTRPLGWDAPQEPLRLPPLEAAPGDSVANTGGARGNN
jgi:membrane peptidoglycan carboxypeptidase